MKLLTKHCLLPELQVSRLLFMAVKKMTLLMRASESLIQRRRQCPTRWETSQEARFGKIRFKHPRGGGGGHSVLAAAMIYNFRRSLMLVAREHTSGRKTIIII
jgi:hypothetical protein